MRNPIVMLVCAMLLPAAALPATSNNPQEEQAVMATLESMAHATIHKDLAALDKIYHPDLTYSHSTASLQSKEQVLKSVAGPSVVESMTFHDTSIRIYGNVALVRGRNELRNGTPGNMKDNHLNILWVLLKGPGPHGWQIVARQTTRLPEK